MGVKEERIMNRYVLTIGIATLLLFASCTALRTSETQKVLTNSIGMKLVLIPKGTFSMGLLPTKCVPNPRTATSSDDRQRLLHGRD